MVVTPERISNRSLNDLGQNLFSERNISQWGWAWGQFLDHDMGLRDETPAEDASIAFDQHDPLESFTNDYGALSFNRTPAAPGTGVSSRREQVNTVSSYIDGSQIYGVTPERLDWLREGPANGDPDDNGARLLLPGNYLPRVDARANPATAPKMDVMGRLAGQPGLARVAGDVRANENIALTAIQTLFAREHNRIVAELPHTLSENLKFEVARRIVAAEIQYITYNEFLPALGVKLTKYDGYHRRVNAGLTNEFAAAGFRSHSMVHGEFEVAYEDGDYTAAQLATFHASGIDLGDEGDDQALTIPLSVAFGNPDLVELVGLERVLGSLSAERQYKNDEQIDNTLRSVLFEVPKPGTTDPTACQAPVVDPQCFSGVADLAALDIQRTRDHGIESYNDMRHAYGLKRKHSFTAITGESTDRLGGFTISDPKILDFTELRDRDGNVIALGSPKAEAEAVTGVRRTTTAARLKAIYRDVDDVDAFVGMSAEPHVAGTEFGELQLAIWKDQFQRLRDGDRFFYRNDPVLQAISVYLGVSYRHSLADIIETNALNTAVAVGPDVFTLAPDASTAATPPHAPNDCRPRHDCHDDEQRAARTRALRPGRR